MLHRALALLFLMAVWLSACTGAVTQTPTAVPPPVVSLSPALLPPTVEAATNVPATVVLSEEAAWMRQHAVALQGIDPDLTDFSDLAPLKQAIGNARVVMLGEQSHGDGATFLAKARLVQFLHQEMGFDVIAFESGIYDCHLAWEQIQRGASVRDSFADAVFPMWSDSAQVRPLVDYLAEQVDSERPLELAGVDIQFSGAGSRSSLIGELKALLEQVGSDWPQRPAWAEVSDVLQNVLSRAYQRGESTISDEQQAAFVSHLAAIRQDLAGRSGDVRDLARWQQILKNVAANATQVWSFDWQNRTPKPNYNRSLRDQQMAENLTWMVHEYYADRKIIVWAATLHLMRGTDGIALQGMPDAYANWMSMGEFVEQQLGQQVYTIGFAAYQGASGRPGEEPTTIVTPQPGDLEALFYQAEFAFAFLDFRQPKPGNAWLQQPRTSSSILGYTPATAVWPEVLDGLVFIETMTPSTS